MAKILVVDDRVEDRELLVTLLNYAGCSVFEAADGAEALELVRTEHPDLVISDVLLPSVDGYEFVRRLRRDDPSIANTKVIFYTAIFCEREARDLAKDIGVCRILAKPTEPQKFLEMVAEELGSSEIREVAPQHQQFEDKHRQLFVNKLLEQVEALTRSESRFRMLAENASDLVFRYTLQPTPGFEYINPASAEMLGYGPEEFYSDPELPFRIVHPEHRDEIIGYFKGKRCPALHNARWIHKTGQVIWIEIRSSYVKDDAGNAIALEGIARNITKRMGMIEEISRSRDELEERVAERTAELKRANLELENKSAKLEVLNQGLQDFAFIAAHDLQEPLRKIMILGSMLKTRYRGPLGEEGGDYLDRMNQSASRMSELLHALREYSRVTTRSIPLETRNLAEIAGDAASDLDIAIEQAEATVEIGELPTARVDPVQMRQLFQNLIGNAIKYFDYRGSVARPVVKVYGHIEDNRCRIFVEDNGIGFDEHYLDRIFRPFQRLHGRGEYEGAGMGLATCSKIVERHCGAITAKSTPGVGSTFIVTFPA